MLNSDVIYLFFKLMILTDVTQQRLIKVIENFDGSEEVSVDKKYNKRTEKKNSNSRTLYRSFE